MYLKVYMSIRSGCKGKACHSQGLSSQPVNRHDSFSIAFIPMKCASRFAYMGGSVAVTPVLRAVWGQAIRRSHTARQDAVPSLVRCHPEVEGPRLRW